MIGRVVVSATALLTLLASGPASAGTVTAGECGPRAPSGGNLVVADEQTLGQVFTAAAGGALQSVDLYLSTPNQTPTDDLTVDFAKFDPVLNTFTTLATATVPPAGLSSNGQNPTLVTVTFSTSVTVVAGEQYGIVLSSQTPNFPTPAEYRAHIADTDPVAPAEQGCPEDSLKVSHNGGPFVDIFPDIDLAFKVLVTEQPVTVTVAIDIKPGSDTNCVNLGSEGVVPVAILGSATFDVTTVDQTTLELAGNRARVKGKSGNIGSFEDVNNDGFLDLVVQFPVEGLNLTDSDVEATLTGTLLDGTPIEGTDDICTVPQGVGSL
jgi:hypothetical protein